MTWLRTNLGLILLGGLAVSGIIATAGYYAWAAKRMPDPEIVSQPMAWQTAATADPVPNTGVDAQGLSLELFMQDRNAEGLTRAQWKLRGNDPAKWVLATKGRPATEYKPVIRYVWTLADGGIFILRNNCFYHKLADPKISRAWIEGDGSAGTNGTVFMLDDRDVPTRTDGCATKNFYVEFHKRMTPQVWRYAPAAQFFKSVTVAPVRVPFKVVTIEIIK